MKEVRILGTLCTLRFERYQSNNTPAITSLRRGKPFLTLTVNWEKNWEGNTVYKKTFQLPLVVIKDYSENKGVAKCLQDGGVVTGGPYMAGTGGGVQVMKLTPEWLEIAKKALKKIPLEST